MRRRGHGRFSRYWQRERAKRVEAEDDQAAWELYMLARMFGRGPFIPFRRSRPSDTMQPYRGFRAGRSRIRPDDTGYDEPAEPEPHNDNAWHEHPWLAGLHDEHPTSAPVLNDPPDPPPTE